MRMYIFKAHIVNNHSRYSTALVRLLGSVMLYFLFSLLAETAYAATENIDPLDSSHGSIWLMNDSGAYFNALLLETDVDFDISGMLARARVRQRFNNTSSFWAEGIYVFPLPENAAVDHFRLRIGERIIEGQIQEKAKARKTYESAKSEGKQGGLIEQHRPNVFTTSLANIAPGETITIEIEYQQTLDYIDGNYKLRFPLVTGPRYQASNPSEAHAYDTPNFHTGVSESVIRPVRIHVRLDTGTPVEDLNSSYHAIDIKQTDSNRYRIALAEDSAPGDRDFELVWRPALKHRPNAAVFKERHDGYDYVMLSLLPPDLQSLGQIQLPRDLVFILDVSGSMAGTSIEQARSSLIQALARLKPEDRFNIIWFNDRSERFYTESMPATDNNIQHASSFVNSLDAGGGTVMMTALSLALDKQPDDSRVRQIVFLTDGNVDNELELFELIKNRLGENRLFTVGIGSAPNSYFMRKAARAGRGTFTYIGNIDEVAQKTSALFEKLASPALINIDVSIQGMDVEIYPEPAPDLYLGEPLVILARGKQLDNSITLNGEYGESLWQQSLVLPENTEHPGIHTAWARSRITALMEQHHDAGAEKQRDALRNQIIQTSMDHHLLSRYTSLVAVDVTPVNSSGMLYSEKLKTKLPHGWKSDPNAQPQKQHMLMAQLNLPQTATSTSLHIMTAAMLFALAMVFYLWRKLL